MSQGEWVLLPWLLGMLGLLSFASGVDSASLSGLAPTNEISWSRVCADLCDAGLTGKPCQVFCTSRRQFGIQSNTVVAEREVDVDVEGTRRGACPTLCQHGIGLPGCNCDASGPSDPGVPWEKICGNFCGDKNRLPGCLQCPDTGENHPIRNNQKNMLNIGASIGPGKISTSTLAPRGASRESDVTGEHEGADLLEPSDVEGLRTTGGRATNADSDDVDWVEFCKNECAKGNGGLACNCDIIP